MPASLLIEGKTFGASRAIYPERSLDLPSDLMPASGMITLRRLLDYVVRAEGAAFRQRMSTISYIQMLTYSIHLGSAVVHRQPGGHLCIVAVPGQHRGRLFLPFADDDPRTAEVVSKVILLAKDQEIKDPVILEQILPRGN